jgi:hypothetical protein
MRQHCMSSKQLHFYATYNDIEKVLQQFEAQQSVIYVLAGLFDHDCPKSFGTYRAINSLSVSPDGDLNRMPGYLIANQLHKILVRKVPQKAGGQKFAIDQYLNPETLYFQSGGLFANKIIVPGKIGTIHQTTDSKKLYDLFSKIMSEHFCRIRSYYVGPEAHGLWESGMRLGLSLNASRDLDLRKLSSHHGPA